MSAPLKFSIDDELKVPYALGANYPELLIVLISSLLISLQYEFNSSITILLALISLASLIVLYVTIKIGRGTKQTIAIVLIMSFIVGFMQFSLPVSLSFLLLFLIRLILSDPKLRFRLVAYCIAGVLSTAFLSSRFFNYTIHLDQACEIIIVLTAIVVAAWQFYTVQSEYIWTNEQLDDAHKRMSTMVSVINKLNRYIPPQIWQPLIKHNAPIEVSNKRTKLTVMFSDIVGFTELSETLSADDVTDILNTYMQRMTDIAQRYDAVLDKFIGDGMVCFFGAPTTKGIREDALACIAMAIDMRREMRTLRHLWRLQGFEGLYVRIGITTGYCHVGNFGSDSRMSYTLIGSEANLASRLECAADNSQILVSQATYDYVCHEYDCVFQGELKLKGFTDVVKTYTVLDPDSKENTSSRWVDHDLPGFNLHLNFEDIKNYDYRVIKNHLNQALEQVSDIEKSKKDQ